MNNTRGFLFALTAATLAGCSTNETSNPTGPSPAPSSTYLYTAYNSAGTVVASGTLTLAFDQSAVEGQRNIKGNAPEVGTGTITGQELADGTLRIEMNAGTAEVIVLEGKFAESGMTGRRLLDTGDPPLDRRIGTFTLYQSGVGTR